MNPLRQKLASVGFWANNFLNIFQGLPNYINTGENQCEEEIVKNPKGFWQNEDFMTTLTRDCTTAYFDSENDKNLQVKLCGYEYKHVSLKKSFFGKIGLTTKVSESIHKY